MTEPAHSLNSPSSFSRRIGCPGSANMERSLPNESSEFADEGRETKHAYFIVFCSDFDTYVGEYMPKSQVEIDEKRKVVTMPVWMAKEKDLI